jgi:hypothetical protein
MIITQICIAILFFFTLNASASQVYYNPDTGLYEERNYNIELSRNNANQGLFLTNQTIPQHSLGKKLFLQFLPSLSIYTGLSTYSTPISQIKYSIDDPNLKSSEKSQIINEQSFISSNPFVGAEFMLPITTRLKIGGGGTYNFTKISSLKSKTPMNAFLNSSIYGKMSFQITQRISLYILGGMQNINFEIYDYMKQSDGNPWYGKALPVEASYNLIASANTNAAFFGFGTSYKFSPSTSLFIDFTSNSISSLNNIKKSDIASNSSYDYQINVIGKNSQYPITQVKFGIAFDFIGLFKEEI